MKNIIQNIDCFEFLKDIKSNSIDLILTDPPYLISKKTNFKKYVNGVERFAISMDFGEWDKHFPNFDILIKEFYRVLKPSGTLIIFFDIWKITFLSELMRKEKFKQIRLIEWIKTNAVPINSRINYLTNGREIALTGVKVSKPTFNSKYDLGIYKYPIEHCKGRIHPTQKPLKLFEELIKKHSKENDIVLDCFLGSGTTYIASLLQNRRFIGTELSKRYYLHILDRVKKYE